MSVEMEKLAAFVKGLGFKSSSQISSAMYVCQEFGDFPKPLGEFKVEKGFGVINEYLLRLVPTLLEDIEIKEFNDYEKEKKMGKMFGNFDRYHDILDMAVYTYLQKEWDEKEFKEHIPRIVKDLPRTKRNLEKVKKELEEMK